MEDSSDEVKHEQQRRNIMYVYICVIYVLSYLSISLSFIKISYFSHLALKLFLEMPI